MGAFLTAAEAGVPVVPVALSGTRGILGGDTPRLRRGSIRVVVGAPLWPEGRDWQAAVRLRDAARERILRHCGEPDLLGGGSTRGE
jgi:1-acyl-sn-glycerol-3-phosphate acyltransferase